MNLNKIAAGLRLIADGLEDWTEEEKVEAAPAPKATPTPAPAAKTPTPTQTAAAPAPEATLPEVSADEIRNLFYELSQQHGKLDMLPVLAEIGVQKVTEATPEQRVLLKQKMLEHWGQG